MEQIRLELKKDGHDVNFVAINKADAVDDQSKLTARCAFPLLQDSDDIQAWTLHHAGHKDDFFIYGADGKLADYLPISGERETDLSSTEGYNNLKDAILDALEQ